MHKDWGMPALDLDVHHFVNDLYDLLNVGAVAIMLPAGDVKVGHLVKLLGLIK